MAIAGLGVKLLASRLGPQWLQGSITSPPGLRGGGGFATIVGLVTGFFGGGSGFFTSGGALTWICAESATATTVAAVVGGAALTGGATLTGGGTASVAALSGALGAVPASAAALDGPRTASHPTAPMSPSTTTPRPAMAPGPRIGRRPGGESEMGACPGPASGRRLDRGAITGSAMAASMAAATSAMLA